MNNDLPEKPLQERLQALADFLPLFEEPGFEFGEWDDYYSFSDTAISFYKMAYDMGWVILGYAWSDWMVTDEATRLRDDPAALAAAAPEQLARLLTVVIRQDRFSEGSLAGAYHSGLLTGIVRRAAVLVRALDGGPRGE